MGLLKIQIILGANVTHQTHAGSVTATFNNTYFFNLFRNDEYFDLHLYAYKMLGGLRMDILRIPIVLGLSFIVENTSKCILSRSK